MEQKNKDISLIVVDAVFHSGFEVEYEDIALPEIQALVDANITTNIYEFNPTSELRHNGRKIRYYKRKGELGNLLSEIIPGEVILTGSFLGDVYYNALVVLLEAIRSSEQLSHIHIPFDCTYSAELKSDSGDTWYECELGNPKKPYFNRYREAVRKHNGCIIEPNEKYRGESQIITLHLWNEWKMMADYLTAKNQANLDRGKGNE